MRRMVLLLAVGFLAGCATANKSDADLGIPGWDRASQILQCRVAVYQALRAREAGNAEDVTTPSCIAQLGANKDAERATIELLRLLVRFGEDPAGNVAPLVAFARERVEASDEDRMTALETAAYQLRSQGETCSAATLLAKAAAAGWLGQETNSDRRVATAGALSACEAEDPKQAARLLKAGFPRPPYREALPVHRPMPQMPLTAARKGLSGFVELRLAIDEKGVPRNVEVTESVPAGVFDASSVATAKRFRYLPAFEGGHPIAVEGVSYTFTFIMGDRLASLPLERFKALLRAYYKQQGKTPSGG